MKLLSWNVNGLGRSTKRLLVKEVILKVQPNVVMFQETKLEDVDLFVIKHVWENGHKDWSFLPSVGA